MLFPKKITTIEDAQTLATEENDKNPAILITFFAEFDDNKKRTMAITMTHTELMMSWPQGSFISVYDVEANFHQYEDELRQGVAKYFEIARHKFISKIMTPTVN